MIPAAWTGPARRVAGASAGRVNTTIPLLSLQIEV